jgi:heptosyltransferase-2
MEDNDKHDVEENVSLLSLIDKDPKNWDAPKVFVTKGEEEFAKNWLVQNNIKKRLLIGMHAGTAIFKNQIKRRWDKDKFGELGRRLVEKYDAQILVFGGEEERDLRLYIKEKIGKGAKVVSNTTIRQTTTIMSHCSLFISNDSSLMHIAASLRIPCVTIFGPTNPKWVYPYKTNYIIIRENLPCSPCFYYSQKPLSCKWGDFRCIKNISVDRVMESIDIFLKNNRLV